jgi:hypothetical protein
LLTEGWPEPPPRIPLKMSDRPLFEEPTPRTTKPPAKTTARKMNTHFARLRSRLKKRVSSNRWPPLSLWRRRSSL